MALVLSNSIQRIFHGFNKSQVRIATLSWNTGSRRQRRKYLVAIWLTFVILSKLLPKAAHHSAFADQPLPRLNVVLFTPSDVEAPATAQSRLNEVANYTEAFFAKWMNHWGYPPTREKIFDRDDRGKLRVLFVRGRQALSSGNYDNARFGNEVRELARARYQLDANSHVWWIWVYLGDPPQRFSGFLGSGNVKQGGNAFTNYSNLDGSISLEEPLGSKFLTEIALKGCMHELGHALGLPHGGPRSDLDLGMPLMGATIPNFRNRTKRNETRSYLSQESAAMLWKHPIFSGTAKNRDLLPKPNFTDLEATFDSKKHHVHITGGLSSSLTAHSVVILDSVPKIHEAYWQKPYVARITTDRKFDVTITEPSRIPGTLLILVCFENGAITGDGLQYGMGSALELPYEIDGRKYRLAPQRKPIVRPPKVSKAAAAG